MKVRKTRYSPAVMRMSQEHNIDLSQVAGSGKAGRITRKDLQKLIDSGNIPVEEGNAPSVTPSGAKQTAQPPKQSVPNITPMPGDVEIPASGVRKAIAANMLRSKHEIPHAWTMIEVDVTNLVKYRDSLKTEFKAREGYNLTYFAFFVKAVAQALKEFPMMNSMWAGDRIIQKKEINISIAVATARRIICPGNQERGRKIN